MDVYDFKDLLRMNGLKSFVNTRRLQNTILDKAQSSKDLSASIALLQVGMLVNF